MNSASDRIGGRSIGSKSISSGISGIDYLLGGGIPGGSLVMIEDSTRCNFADEIVKMFMAEGFHEKNSLHLVSDGSSTSCQDFLKTLPRAIVDESSSNDDKNAAMSLNASSNNMEIAFRYDHLPVKSAQVVSSARRERYHFDSSKPISAEDLSAYKYFTSFDADLNAKNNYRSIIAQLKRILFGAEAKEIQESARWYRIVVRNVGSLLYETTNDPHALIQFVEYLRAFAHQKSTAVVLITISTDLVDESVVRRLRQKADAVFRLDPINLGDKEKKILDYHGFFRCYRTPSINSISFPTPDSADYAFKVKRKEFLIERLHLPPDLSETASRAQLETVSCSSGMSKSKLDF